VASLKERLQEEERTAEIARLQESAVEVLLPAVNFFITAEKRMIQSSIIYLLHGSFF
jgi:hypothetical protein